MNSYAPTIKNDEGSLSKSVTPRSLSNNDQQESEQLPARKSGRAQWLIPEKET